MAQLKCILFTAILLSCLIPVSSGAVAAAACNKCTSLPPDCLLRDDAPFEGGPHCACTNTYHPNGCTLKPCDLVETDDICDCTLSTGSFQSVVHPHRLHCRKYQCTGNSGECEFCKELPPDCTHASYSNSPSAGGPDCACEAAMTPGGCTLKTCGPGSHAPEDPCVPRNGVSENATFIWYGTTCPGKLNIIPARNTEHRDLATAWGLVWTGVVFYLLSVVGILVTYLQYRLDSGEINIASALPKVTIVILLFVVGSMFMVKGCWFLYYK